MPEDVQTQPDAVHNLAKFIEFNTATPVAVRLAVQLPKICSERLRVDQRVLELSAHRGKKLLLLLGCLLGWVGQILFRV